MSMERASYDSTSLIADAKRWRELAAQSQSPKREEYVSFAEKCEDLVSRSNLTCPPKD